MPETTARLRQVYDDQLRTTAEVIRADSWDTDGPLLRAVYEEDGFVTYRDLGGLIGERLDALIARTIEHFAELEVRSFEWKSRGHDAPVDLPDRLLRHGFEAQDPETVMVGVASRLATPADEVGLPDGVVCRRATTEADVERAVHLAAEVFGTPGPSAATLWRQLRADPERVELWLVEVRAAAHGGDMAGEAPRVIATGRLDIVEGTDFAGLWGGSAHRDWRGRGLYRALTAARARSAVAKGVRYLHSDCTPMSRPILERNGLAPITTTTPFVYTFC